jgi:hypothetical protein
MRARWVVPNVMGRPAAADTSTTPDERGGGRGGKGKCKSSSQVGEEGVKETSEEGLWTNFCVRGPQLFTHAFVTDPCIFFMQISTILVRLMFTTLRV